MSRHTHGLVLGLALGLMLTTGPPLTGQDAATRMKAIPQPIINVEATLVTTSATIHPAQPMAGQAIQVEAIVENQGGPASNAGLGFLVACVKLPDGPQCPAQYPYTASMPSIAYGQSHKVLVSLGNQWAPGTYRLVAGTDVIFDHDARDLELVVKPLHYSGVQMREGDVASQVFTAPSWNGKRVDLCLVWGGQCGEPAATEFCKRSDYVKATDWQPANDIGAQTPTIVLETGQTCDQPFCDGFASITCTK